MDPGPIFLTETQELAIRRMERLGDLRRKRESFWRVHGSQLLAGALAPHLPLIYSGFFVSQVYGKPLNKVSIVGLSLLAVYAAMCVAFSFVIRPMMQRIRNLEQALEEELSRTGRVS